MASTSTSVEYLLQLRGGAKRRKRGTQTSSLSSLRSDKARTKSKKLTATGKSRVGRDEDEKSALSDLMKKYRAILPLTRLYITLVGLTTILGLVLGEEGAQALFALDTMRVLYCFEFWRPITAACYFGPLSIGWLMSAYYIFEYGSNLERAHGSAQQLVFIIGQMALLTLVSSILGEPFFASSMITSMLHVLSRSMPDQKVKWLIFTVPYWSLPYGLMASDLLQAQPGKKVSAVVPHVLGILSGHFYFFHKFIWPKTGGEDWLVAPSFLSKRMDPNYGENEVKKSIEIALKKRKKGKGRKLSG